MVLIASSKQKKTLFTVLGVVLFFAIGIAIPKLTVHDTVPAGSDYSCVDSILHKPLAKFSWEYWLRATGQTQVVHADSGYGEMKFYTLFRIPLKLNMSINCLRTASSTGLVDGKEYSIGVFHDSQVVDGTKSYTSQRFGLSFKYPIDFSVFDGGPDTSGVSPSDGYISIGPEPYTTQALTREFPGELPAGMAFSFYRNTQHLPLERWIKETNPAYTNYNPSVDPTTNLTQTTIAGVPAFKYHSEMGLYVTDYVTFLYKDWTVMFVVNDMGPNTQADMQAILSSIQFSNSTNSAFVSVGDKLGAMTVVSVKPFNTGQYSPDPKMMQLGPQNIQANLKDPIEVTGAYSAVHSGIGFDGYCMSVSDTASLARLPALPGGPSRPYFCFHNSETAKQKLGETSRTVTVTIDNYQLNSYPSEVVDWADLISVVKD